MIHSLPKLKSSNHSPASIWLAFISTFLIFLLDDFGVCLFASKKRMAIKLAYRGIVYVL